jgi:hypothetical protein
MLPIDTHHHSIGFLQIPLAGILFAAFNRLQRVNSIAQQILGAVELTLS